RVRVAGHQPHNALAAHPPLPRDPARPGGGPGGSVRGRRGAPPAGQAPFAEGAAPLSPPISDGAGSPVDQGVATWLFVGAVLFGWIGVQRLRGRSLTRLPKMAGWGAAALAATCLVLALVLPPIIRPDLASARPSSSARLRFLSPRPGQ